MVGECGNKQQRAQKIVIPVRVQIKIAVLASMNCNFNLAIGI